MSELSAPHAGGGVEHVRADVHRRGHGGTDALHRGQDVRGPIGDIQQDGVLVTAEAGDRVGGAHRPLDPAADLTQQDVAGRMAEAVVDQLEPVDVEEQDRERRTGPLHPLDRHEEVVQEQGSVGQPGERVVQRQPPQGLLGLLAVADVRQRAGEPAQPAAVAHGDAPGHHPQPGPVAPADPELVAQPDGLAGQVTAQPVPQRLDVVGVDPLPQAAGRQLEVVRGLAEHLLQPRRGVHQTGLAVPVIQAVVRPRGAEREPLLAARQLALGPHPLGDLPQGHHLDLDPPPAQRGGVHLDHDLAAIGAGDVQLGQPARTTGGPGERQPEGQRAQLAKAPAQHPGGGRVREAHLAGAVHEQDAVHGRPHDVGEVARPGARAPLGQVRPRRCGRLRLLTRHSATSSPADAESTAGRARGPGTKVPPVSRGRGVTPRCRSGVGAQSQRCRSGLLPLCSRLLPAAGRGHDGPVPTPAPVTAPDLQMPPAPMAVRP